MQDLIVDVGANEGAFALEVAARNPGLRVLAIEPIPELCQQIAKVAGTRALGNVVVRQLAIDAIPRTAAFHISDFAGHGASSLLEFDRSRIARDEYWRERPDLRCNRSIDVSVARLDSLPEVMAAARIRFIKIDAQGMDVAAFESLGAYLERVDAGMLEVPTTLESTLYAHETHDLHSAMTRLAALGFHIYAVKPNDHASNEMNLFFCRPGLEPHAIEQALQLRGIALYDGKHFWHSPSHTLNPDYNADEVRLVVERLALVEHALALERAETRRLLDVVADRDKDIQALHLSLEQTP